jgi:dipeptidyl aminopeptidase/acylaminoacyl peptidase
MTATRGPFLVLGRSRLPRRLWRIAGVLGLLWALASIGAVIWEREITYQPNPTRTAPAAVRLDRVVERQLVAADGARLVVWRLAARPGMPTLLFFHGNGEALTYRAGRIAAFEAEGWGVHMMAYRGFSGSTGRPSESAIVADALAAYDQLVSEGVAARDIVIYGESLGTSVALQTALARPAAALVSTPE